MRHDSNFVCQACGLETRSVGRAERHEMSHEGHEVFEFEQPLKGTIMTETPETRDEDGREAKEALTAAMQALTRVCAERDDANRRLGAVAALADEGDRRTGLSQGVVFATDLHTVLGPVSGPPSGPGLGPASGPVSGAVEGAGDVAAVDLAADWLSYDGDTIHSINVGLTEAHEAFDAAYFRSTTGREVLSNVDQTIAALTAIRDRLTLLTTPVVGHEQEVRAEEIEHADKHSLWEALDAINEASKEPTIAGIDAEGRAFLAYLAEEGGDATYPGVVLDEPHQTAYGLNGDRECSECGCPQRRWTLDDLKYPVRTMAARASGSFAPVQGDGE